MKHAVGAPSAVVWTTATAVAFLICRTPAQLIVFAIVEGLICAAEVKDVRPLRRLVYWNLPVLLPLLLIHGVLNPSFPPSPGPFGLSIRPSGVEFAVLLASRVLAWTAMASYWFECDWDEIMELALRLRVPDSIVVILAMAASSSRTVQRTIIQVRDAQQARGIRVHGSLLTRAPSLVAIVLPVVVTAITEADFRAMMLRHRGLGTHPLELAQTRNRSVSRMTLAGTIVALCAAMIAGHSE